LINVGQTQI